MRQLLVFFVIAGILSSSTWPDGLQPADPGEAARARDQGPDRQLDDPQARGADQPRRRDRRQSRPAHPGRRPESRPNSRPTSASALIQSSVLLASFIGVLWILSQGVVIPIGGRAFRSPATWSGRRCSTPSSRLAGSPGGSAARWCVSGATRYAREAEFRVALVRGRERAEGIALSNGEADEPARASPEPRHLIAVLRQRHRAGPADLGHRRHTAGWRWSFPIIVAAPGYFAGPSELRRADDGRRRLQPGAAVAALVRRQHRHHRRLAGDAARG